MARQIGSTFRGTVDGLTLYYNKAYGYLVRRTGGVTSKQYRKDARYAAARANSSELGLTSKAGSLIREALGSYALQVKDGTMVNRMNSELIALKQLDRTHLKGGRRPEVMMADPKAGRTFRIFQFNDQAKLYDLMEQYPQQVQQAGKLVVSDLRLRPERFPEGAMHAGVTLVRTVIDFETGAYRTTASVMHLLPKDEPAPAWLEIAQQPEGKGIELVCLQVVFFCACSGDLVQLKERVHAMGVLQVSAVRQRSGAGTKQEGTGTNIPWRPAVRTAELPVRRRKRRPRRDYKLLLRGEDTTIYEAIGPRAGTDTWFVFRGAGKHRKRVPVYGNNCS